MRSVFILLCLSISILSCNEQDPVTEDTITVDTEIIIPNETGSENIGLLWSEEFDGDSVDTDTWRYDIGANGWGNNEWQDYTAGTNSSVSNGTLKIIAKKVGPGQNLGDYTSSRMLSNETFQYGRVEIRAKLPAHQGNGLWPALWMLGEDIFTIGWPQCGEIDVMEYVSYTPNNVVQTIHSVANNHTNGTEVSTGFMPLETIEEEFHNYGLIWEEDKLEFYLDTPDNITLTIDRPENYNNDNWPFGKPYFFILNVAVGGNWGGVQGVDDTIFPAQMEVDYVRLYELD